MPGLRPRSRTSVYSLALAALAAQARLPPFARNTVLRVHGLGRPRGSRRAFRSWRICAAAALRTEYRATPPWLRPRSRTSVYSLALGALAAPSAPGGVARLPPFARSTVLRIHAYGLAPVRPCTRSPSPSLATASLPYVRVLARPRPPWLRTPRRGAAGVAAHAGAAAHEGEVAADRAGIPLVALHLCHVHLVVQRRDLAMAVAVPSSPRPLSCSCWWRSGRRASPARGPSAPGRRGRGRGR